jgi:hypothetical protein
MNKLTNGTQYRTTPNGYIVTRGKRSLYINGTSVANTKQAQHLIANNSFNSLFSTAAPISPLGRNTRFITL